MHLEDQLINVIEELVAPYRSQGSVDFKNEILLIEPTSMDLKEISYCKESLMESVENFVFDKIGAQILGVSWKQKSGKNVVGLEVSFDEEFTFCLETLEQIFLDHRSNKQIHLERVKFQFLLFACKDSDIAREVVERATQSLNLPVYTSINEIALFERFGASGWLKNEQIARFHQ